MTRLVAALGLLVLSACAALPTPRERRDHADALAAAQGWRRIGLPTPDFVLAGYVPGTPRQADTLTVYIEGDGFAWAGASSPSLDPTPRTPLALQLALAHPDGAAAYLARPCQFGDAQADGCPQRYWTGARFAPEVVASMDRALDALKARFGAVRLQLVGYSGGGALATLLTARRRDVALLVTVAGNLDPEAWARLHRLTPLSQSLNPADARASLAGVEQWHLSGGADTQIPPGLSRDFVSGLAEPRRAHLLVVPGFTHQCCWAEQWPALWGRLK